MLISGLSKSGKFYCQQQVEGGRHSVWRQRTYMDVLITTLPTITFHTDRRKWLSIRIIGLREPKVPLLLCAIWLLILQRAVRTLQGLSGPLHVCLTDWPAMLYYVRYLDLLISGTSDPT